MGLKSGGAVAGPRNGNIEPDKDSHVLFCLRGLPGPLILSSLMASAVFPRPAASA